MRINKETFRQNLFEYTISDLKTMSDSKRVDRAKPITINFMGVIKGNDEHLRTLWSVPSQSGQGTYTVTISIEPIDSNLFAIAKGKWDIKRFNSIISESDVKVHCECKDFLYGGAKYNLGANGKHKGSGLEINSGHIGETDVTTQAPNKTDPDRQSVMCKHLIAVSNRFNANGTMIMSDARKYQHTDEFKATLTKKVVDDKKDIELTELPKSEGKSITENLFTTKADIDNQEQKVIDPELIDSLETTQTSEENIDEIIEEPIDDTQKQIDDEVDEEPEEKDLDVNELLGRPDPKAIDNT